MRWLFGVMVVGGLGWATYGDCAIRQVTIAQEGAFRHNQAVVDAKWIRYGFVTQLGDAWEAPGEVEITYSSDGFEAPSKAIQVSLPNLIANKKMIYQIGAVAGGWQGERTYWSEERFINLEQPQGTIVSLPLLNSASYAFSEKDFDLMGCLFSVSGLMSARDSQCGHLASAAVLEEIYYGFTNESYATVLSGNVSWVNSFGQQAAEGTIRIWDERHNNGYKGTMYRVFPHWVRVPTGMNLVFRARYFSQLDGHPEETPVMFVQMR